MLSLAFGSPASAAAPSSRLANETLVGSADTPSGLPTACSLGRNTARFAFTGTASGPYAGTFTETGHITYKLSSNSSIALPEDGLVTHFSGRFTISSRSGTVTGVQTLDQTLSSGFLCDESPGGTSVSSGICQTSLGEEQCSATPVPTRYVAHATTGTRIHVDKGASTVSLDSTQESGVALNQHSSIRVKLRLNTTLAADHELRATRGKHARGRHPHGGHRRKRLIVAGWQPLTGTPARLARPHDLGA